MEPRKVSITKSVSWRVIGIALLSVITYVVTQDIIVTTWITVLHHLAFVFIYYFHERFWEGKSARGKPLLKAFTYEIVLGFLVLGTITLILTGSWKQVTNITVLYLIIRYLGYPVHDWFWSWFYARCHRRG